MVLIGVCIGGIFCAIIRIMENTVENIEPPKKTRFNDRPYLERAGIALSVFLLTTLALIGFPVLFFPWAMVNFFCLLILLGGKFKKSKKFDHSLSSVDNPAYNPTHPFYMYKDD